MRIAIALRTCTSVRTTFGNDRMIDDAKSTITLTCLNSLLKAIKHTDHEVIFSIHDDNSSEQALAMMDELCSQHKVKYELFKCDRLRNFMSQYEWCKKTNAEAIYCVEDDYLHHENAIQDMVDACVYMGSFAPGVYCVYPFNNPHRYNSFDMLYPSYILKGPKQYWRSIVHSPHTFFMPSIVFHAHDDIMRLQADTWPNPECFEDNTINKVWRDGSVRLICPMNSLALHIEDKSSEELYYDWKPLWKDNLIRIE